MSMTSEVSELVPVPADYCYRCGRSDVHHSGLCGGSARPWTLRKWSEVRMWRVLEEELGYSFDEAYDITSELFA